MNNIHMTKMKRIFNAWLKYGKNHIYGYTEKGPLYDYYNFAKWWDKQTQSFKSQVIKGEHERPAIY